MTFGLDHQKDEDVPQAKLLIYIFLFLDGWMQTVQKWDEVFENGQF